jgi:hypothetical protein
MKAFSNGLAWRSPAEDTLTPCVVGGRLDTRIVAKPYCARDIAGAVAALLGQQEDGFD